MSGTASTCFAMLRVPVIRATQLNSCGTVVTGTGVSITTDGMITVEMTLNQQDRQDYFETNADNVPLVTDTAAPILKWIDLKVTFGKVDPVLISMLTGEALVLNDASTPVAVGWDTSVGAANTVNFGLETWTRISSGGTCVGTYPLYGYMVLPWITQGVLGDVSFDNGNANFTVSARTQAGSNWGVGPYNVIRSAATATLNMPMPLLTAVGSQLHRRTLVTTLAPPPPVCGGGDLPTGPLTITKAALVATLTFPVPSILPATINWGDATTPQSVTTGTTVNHTYAGAGTYTVTMATSAYSAAAYSGTITVP